jgi:NADH-quinone oxidoreductase subunit C
MSVFALDRLAERFGDAITERFTKLGDDVAIVRRERIIDVLRFLRDEPDLAFNFCSTVTAIDWFEREPRFEVVYQLYSISRKHRLRVKAGVPEEDPSIDSSVGLYAGNNWFEREVWDMYGIKFKGHPDLRRMFMWKSFEGHPLRKDYPKDKRQPLARREGITR